MLQSPALHLTAKGILQIFGNCRVWRKIAKKLHSKFLAYHLEQKSRIDIQKETFTKYSLSRLFFFFKWEKLLLAFFGGEGDNW